jgi:uncharacterized membrane protein YoaK (UPF0700 family)
MAGSNTLIIYLACILSFIVGIIVGASLWYQYANHIFMKHPYFFRKVIEYKIERLERRRLEHGR